jgi:hypothetical protein
MPEFTQGDSAPGFDECPPVARLPPPPNLPEGEGAITALEPVPSPTARQAATRTVNQLRAALVMHGITFPSLDLDVVSLAGTHGPPLVELGRINLETARLLTQVLSGTGRR